MVTMMAMMMMMRRRRRRGEKEGEEEEEEEEEEEVEEEEEKEVEEEDGDDNLPIHCQKSGELQCVTMLLSLRTYFNARGLLTGMGCYDRGPCVIKSAVHPMGIWGVHFTYELYALWVLPGCHCVSQIRPRSRRELMNRPGMETVAHVCRAICIQDGSATENMKNNKIMESMQMKTMSIV
ncbi:hypothetical protein PoB_006465500 [Plakobranchus ocellatus]|uniref:Uncharacterized protein n=1 Tax=Plakobranchus ocellatus TaxID=259542 RepID=A0AAV4D265_9GAST|nr:hypothetical protein PoB_006465500 [Plakobranchus ocellatus]